MIQLNILTKVSIFGTISFVLMKLLEFPIPLLFPDFLKFDISEVPALIIGFAISPAAGVCVVLLKNAIHFVTTFNILGTLVANNIAGIAFVGLSALIYSRNKNLKGAIIGMCSGTIAMALIMIPVNRVLLPLWGMAYDPAAHKLIFFVIPLFNILKGSVDTLITYFLYKRVSSAFLKDKTIK
ncbi:MAG TPA: ECF transporter S component [Candidatus Wallbacteria bacterium]|nr:ECF transporter S component [Candidatus Wallbacteria bacterium]